MKTEIEELRDKVAALTVKNELLSCEIKRKESEVAHWRAMALEENGAADALAKACQTCKYKSSVEKIMSVDTMLCTKGFADCPYVEVVRKIQNETSESGLK